MDSASQHVAAALEALSRVVDRLRSFGYSLYLKTKARGWTQPRGLVFLQNAVTVGFAIHLDDSGEKSVIFSIEVARNAAHWSIQCSVDDEDGDRDQITRGLWQSPEYRAATLDEMVTSLDQALETLISSTNQAAVAATLARAGSRE